MPSVCFCSCIDSWFEINRSCPEHPSDWLTTGPTLNTVQGKKHTQKAKYYRRNVQTNVQCAKEPVLSFYCCLNGGFDQDRLKMRHTYQRVKSLSVSWPSCLLQDISWSCRGYLDTGVTKSGETIKVINTYVSWQNPSSYQNNYSLRTEPKEKKKRNCRTIVHSLHLTSADDTAENPPPFLSSFAPLQANRVP